MNSALTKHSLNVPVLLWVWTRPEKIRKVFDVIRYVRPKTLFLVSDGPRTCFVNDQININKSREIVENIDWECTVHKLYFENNQGMYAIFKHTLEFVFKHVDRCIFLEDDVVPSFSYFRFNEELLEKYKDDLRINLICGMNHMGIYEDCPFDYFFSKGASIWGIAFWKRTYEQFFNFTYGANPYTLKNVLNNAKRHKGFSKSAKGYLKDGNYGGHPPSFEFFLGLANYASHQLNIVPTRNMICNIGFGKDSTHSNIQLNQMPKRVSQYFNMQTHELSWPLKHPTHIVEDTFFEKRLYKIMGLTPFLAIMRKVEFYFRAFWFGNKRELAIKQYKKLCNYFTVVR